MSSSYVPKKPVSAIYSGSGVQCTPNPITASGTVSLDPAISIKVSRLSVSGTTTTVDGPLHVTNGEFKVDTTLDVDPFFVVDPLAALTVHGTDVYCNNIVTPSTNLTALATTVSNHTSSIMELEDRTAFQSTDTESTYFIGDVFANRYKVLEGKSSQYMMADGSLLEASSSNASSNIYKYQTSDVTVSPPQHGEIRFNANTNAETTTVWISHLTRDDIDIDPFLNLITELSVIYIQEESDSSNFVKFSVNGVPSVAPPTTTVPVVFVASNGAASFGHNTQVFMSIFTNDIEIDSRLSDLETKTLLISQSGGVTSTSQLNVQNNRITNVAMPVDSQDAVNVTYLEEQDYATNDDLVSELAKKLDLTPSVETAAAQSAALGSLIEELIVAGAITALTSTIGSAIASTLATEGFVKADGSVPMTGSLQMDNQSITGANEVQGVSAVFSEMATGTLKDPSYTSSMELAPTSIELTSPAVTINGNVTINGDTTAGDVYTQYIINPADNLTNIEIANGAVTVTPLLVANLNLQVGGNAQVVNTVTAAGYKVPGATNVSFLKANGGIDSTAYATQTNLTNELSLKLDTSTAASTYATQATLSEYVTTTDATSTFLSKAGGIMTGGINMGNSSLTNANQITANSSITGASIVRTGGLASQFLKANGTIDTNTYLLTTQLQTNFVFNGTNCAFHARRQGMGAQHIISMFLTGFTATVATTGATVISNAALTSTFRPPNAVFFPVRILKNGAMSIGICIIYASGEMGLTDVGQTANFWTAGQSCGIAGDTNVTYICNN